MAIQKAVSSRTAALDATKVLANSGFLRIYSGAAPDPDSAPGTLLAELDFSVTAFGATTDDGTNSSATANAITDEASAPATGTASYYRVYQSDGTTVAWQGDSITTTGGGGDLELNTLTITTGLPVSISSFVARFEQIR